MPFELKNAGATYQRLVNRMFNKQIGRNMEVYVDDMLIKSKEEFSYLDDLKETFITFKQYQMKLNRNKYAFGVASRKFLGFLFVLKGDRRKPKKGVSHIRDGVTKDGERSLEINRKDSSTQ